ncbi:MAG TPA: RT0821/Lpp0805 family surface protein, partial [Alphaproteobacteria bacterium]|nr:RT0821/Lpp0805 family surface protein [Alphaproteobacteria bacterium]
SGVRNEWYNPDSGNYGRITPQPAYQTATGAYCREYQSSVVVGGQVQSGYGTACRQPDGNWVVVN